MHWSPSLPSSYPIPHAYEKQQWEEELEVETRLDRVEGDGEDPPNSSRIGPHIRHRPLAVVRLPLLPLEEITKLPRKGGKRQNPYQGPNGVIEL